MRRSSTTNRSTVEAFEELYKSKVVSGQKPQLSHVVDSHVRPAPLNLHHRECSVSRCDPVLTQSIKVNALQPCSGGNQLQAGSGGNQPPSCSGVYQPQAYSGVNQLKHYSGNRPSSNLEYNLVSPISSYESRSNTERSALLNKVQVNEEDVEDWNESEEEDHEALERDVDSGESEVSLSEDDEGVGEGESKGAEVDEEEEQGADEEEANEREDSVIDGNTTSSVLNAGQRNISSLFLKLKAAPESRELSGPVRSAADPCWPCGSPQFPALAPCSAQTGSWRAGSVCASQPPMLQPAVPCADTRRGSSLRDGDQVMGDEGVEGVLTRAVHPLSVLLPPSNSTMHSLPSTASMPLAPLSPKQKPHTSHPSLKPSTACGRGLLGVSVPLSSLSSPCVSSSMPSHQTLISSPSSHFSHLQGTLPRVPSSKASLPLLDPQQRNISELSTSVDIRSRMMSDEDFHTLLQGLDPAQLSQPNSLGSKSLFLQPTFTVRSPPCPQRSLQSLESPPNPQRVLVSGSPPPERTLYNLHDPKRTLNIESAAIQQKCLHSLPGQQRSDTVQCLSDLQRAVQSPLHSRRVLLAHNPSPQKDLSIHGRHELQRTHTVQSPIGLQRSLQEPQQAEFFPVVMPLLRRCVQHSAAARCRERPVMDNTPIQSQICGSELQRDDFVVLDSDSESEPQAPYRPATCVTVLLATDASAASVHPVSCKHSQPKPAGQQMISKQDEPQQVNVSISNEQNHLQPMGQPMSSDHGCFTTADQSKRNDRAQSLLECQPMNNVQTLFLCQPLCNGPQPSGQPVNFDHTSIKIVGQTTRNEEVQHQPAGLSVTQSSRSVEQSVPSFMLPTVSLVKLGVDEMMHGKRLGGVRGELMRRVQGQRLGGVVVGALERAVSSSSLDPGRSTPAPSHPRRELVDGQTMNINQGSSFTDTDKHQNESSFSGLAAGGLTCEIRTVLSDSAAGEAVPSCPSRFFECPSDSENQTGKGCPSPATQPGKGCPSSATKPARGFLSSGGKSCKGFPSPATKPGRCCPRPSVNSGKDCFSPADKADKDRLSAATKLGKGSLSPATKPGERSPSPATKPGKGFPSSVGKPGKNCLGPVTKPDKGCLNSADKPDKDCLSPVAKPDKGCYSLASKLGKGCLSLASTRNKGCLSSAGRPSKGCKDIADTEHGMKSTQSLEQDLASSSSSSAAAERGMAPSLCAGYVAPSEALPYLEAIQFLLPGRRLTARAASGLETQVGVICSPGLLSVSSSFSDRLLRGRTIDTSLSADPYMGTGSLPIKTSSKLPEVRATLMCSEGKSVTLDGVSSDGDAVQGTSSQIASRTLRTSVGRSSAVGNASDSQVEPLLTPYRPGRTCSQIGDSQDRINCSGVRDPSSRHHSVVGASLMPASADMACTTAYRSRALISTIIEEREPVCYEDTLSAQSLGVDPVVDSLFKPPLVAVHKRGSVETCVLVDAGLCLTPEVKQELNLSVASTNAAGRRSALNESFRFLDGMPSGKGTKQDPLLMDELPVARRSGRVQIPRLAWWANQRVHVDPTSKQTSILPGTPNVLTLDALQFAEQSQGWDSVSSEPVIGQHMTGYTTNVAAAAADECSTGIYGFSTSGAGASNAGTSGTGTSSAGACGAGTSGACASAGRGSAGTSGTDTSGTGTDYKDPDSTSDDKDADPLDVSDVSSGYKYELNTSENGNNGAFDLEDFVQDLRKRGAKTSPKSRYSVALCSAVGRDSSVALGCRGCVSSANSDGGVVSASSGCGHKADSAGSSKTKHAPETLTVKPTGIACNSPGKIALKSPTRSSKSSTKTGSCSESCAKTPSGKKSFRNEKQDAASMRAAEKQGLVAACGVGGKRAAGEPVELGIVDESRLRDASAHSGLVRGSASTASDTDQDHASSSSGKRKAKTLKSAADKGNVKALEAAGGLRRAAETHDPGTVSVGDRKARLVNVRAAASERFRSSTICDENVCAADVGRKRTKVADDVKHGKALRSTDSYGAKACQGLVGVKGQSSNSDGAQAKHGDKTLRKGRGKSKGDGEGSGLGGTKAKIGGKRSNERKGKDKGEGDSTNKSQGRAKVGGKMDSGGKGRNKGREQGDRAQSLNKMGGAGKGNNEDHDQGADVGQDSSLGQTKAQNEGKLEAGGKGQEQSRKQGGGKGQSLRYVLTQVSSAGDGSPATEVWSQPVPKPNLKRKNPSQELATSLSAAMEGESAPLAKAARLGVSKRQGGAGSSRARTGSHGMPRAPAGEGSAQQKAAKLKLVQEGAADESFEIYAFSDSGD